MTTVLDIFQRLEYWFIPPSPIFSDYMTRALSESKRTSRIMVLGMNLVRAFRQDSHAPMVLGYIGLLDRFEDKLGIDSRVRLPLDEIGDGLMALLEASDSSSC
jgi:hypothetical protein